MSEITIKHNLFISYNVNKRFNIHRDKLSVTNNNVI